VDAADYVVWRQYEGTNNVWADGDGNGSVGPEDFALWRANYGREAGTVNPPPNPVPEPSAMVLCVALLATSTTWLRLGTRAWPV
jgi:hypothetical protein